MLEKKFFETFMIESRKENKELREQIQKGDKQIIDKIKQIAKQEQISSKKESEREKVVSFQVPLEKGGSQVESPLLGKNLSAQSDLHKYSFKGLPLMPDPYSKILNTQLEM